jgi:hypothetical protein
MELYNIENPAAVLVSANNASEITNACSVNGKIINTKQFENMNTQFNRK